MAYSVTVNYRDGTSQRYEHVEGWRIGDPPGWVQLISPEDVVFLTTRDIAAVVVPNLALEVAKEEEVGEEPESPYPWLGG